MDDPRDALHRIEFDVDWPPGHVACYLYGGDEPVLFDAGTPDGLTPGTTESETLTEGITDAGYDISDIEHLVVTHPHVDHIGQVPTVIDAADPKLYVPHGVKERFAGDSSALAERVHENAKTAGISGARLDNEVESAVESLERNRRLLPPDDVDEWLSPGDISIGPLDGTAIHTPGHQADHFAYLIDAGEQSVLFSGDTVMEPFRAVVLHDGMDDGHKDAFSASFTALDRLDGYDPDHVYPGHGEAHDAFDDILTRDRQRLDARLDRIETLVSEGHETLPEVADALARGRDARYMFSETLSGLAHLEQQGRIDADLIEGVRHYK